MARILALVAIAAAATAITTVSTPPSARPPQPSASIGSDACGRAAATVADNKKLPHVAYDCIQSIPLNLTQALGMTRALKPLLEFQSTLTYLKNPQEVDSEYEYPGIDILSGVDNIEQKAKTGFFESHFDFESALEDLANSAHDGHLSIKGKSQALFHYRVAVKLASVSPDGVQIPKIYVATDVLEGTEHDFSEVTTINGLPVEEFIAQEASMADSHDVDANYNSVFYSVTAAAQKFGFSSSRFAAGTSVYPGNETILSFANGSTRSFLNMAVTTADFNGVTSSQSFYDVNMRPSTDDELRAAMSSPSGFLGGDNPIQLPGFPLPTVIALNGSVSAYLPNDPGLQNVAILAITGFFGLKEFQKTVHDALTAFKAAGRTNLIVDLQYNRGGVIVAGLDLFGQLFPDVSIFSAANQRAHEALDQIGQLAQPPFSMEDNWFASVSRQLFNLGSSNKTNGSSFSSWSEYYGPVSHQSDLFTQSAVTNLGYFGLLQGLTVTGTSHRPKSDAPFAPENIIMLTDGMCASTCALFSGLMKRQAGVRSLTIGGRPRSGPMQALGATKGAQFVPYGLIYNWTANVANASLIHDALPAIPAGFRAKVAGTALGDVVDTMYSLLRYLPRRSVKSAGVNFSNQLRHDDADAAAIPLQFVYEAADCRLFWTKPMLQNATAVWEAVANAAFDGGECVPGSTGHPSSVSGGAVGPEPFNATALPKYGDGKGSAKALAPQGLVLGSGGLHRR